MSHQVYLPSWKIWVRQPWGDHENGILMVNDPNIWLVVEPPIYPSEKWWTNPQLGWWHSQYDGKKKCSKPSTRNVLDISSTNTASYIYAYPNVMTENHKDQAHKFHVSRFHVVTMNWICRKRIRILISIQECVGCIPAGLDMFRHDIIKPCNGKNPLIYWCFMIPDASHTVDGRNPAPVDSWFIPLFIGF